MESGNGQSAIAKGPKGPGWHDVVRVAARASVDPKTVARYLEGGNTHATTRRRIERGLELCGLAAFVRAHV